MSGPLFLGIDGGATACRARIEDAAGTRLGEGRAGTANPRLGLEAACAAILAAAGEALRAAGLPESAAGRLQAGLGLAGVAEEPTRSRMRAWRHPFGAMVLETDAHVACLGAHGGGDGAIMVLGTGSCGVALEGGRVRQVGGRGFPVSDHGSGAWLGLEALRLALLAADGAAPASPLAAAVMARFDGRPEQVVAWLDGARPKDYAALAPLVLEHAAAGEPAAAVLVRQAAADAARLIRALLAGGAARLCLMGGLAAPLAPWLPEDVRGRLSEPLGDALDGALLLARRAGSLVASKNTEPPGQPFVNRGHS